MINCLLTYLIIKLDLVTLTVEKFFRAWFVFKSATKKPEDVLHMYVENEPAMNKNEVALNNLPGELYITEADEKIQGNCITHWS